MKLVFFAFDCNAKSFLIAFPLLFFFSFSSVFQKRTGKKRFVSVSLFVTPETCDQDWTYFIGLTGKYFHQVSGYC